MNTTHGLPVFDIDPYDPALLRAPAEYYGQLRALGPLVWIPRYGVCASGHIAVVEPAFRDWRRFCSARGVGLAAKLGLIALKSLGLQENQQGLDVGLAQRVRVRHRRARHQRRRVAYPPLQGGVVPAKA